MSTDVSVVIVSYNVEDLLRKCLHSVLTKTRQSLTLEVFVVDNASADGTVAMLEKEFPQVKRIANTTNAGFPKGNNQAFERCEGEFIFMLNPDTELHDDAIGNLVDVMRERNDIALIGPKLLNTDGSLQHSFWRAWTVWWVFLDSFHLRKLTPKRFYSDKNRNEPFDADTVSGAAIFFRRAVMEKIGMLDEKLFWIEDADFCWRAVCAGLKLVYWPKIALTHHVGQSAKKSYVISLSNQIFNKIKYFRKHGSAFQTFLVKLISCVHVTYKLLIFGILAPFRPVFAAKARAYAYTWTRVFNPPDGIQ